MSNLRYMILDPSQPAVDAAGLMRTGATPLLDGKILNIDDTYVWQTVGTGTGSWANNNYNLSVTSGQYLVRQTKRYYPYFSGYSQRVVKTFDSFAPAANLDKRVGYFSSNAVAPYASNYDGFWLHSAGGSITLNVANNGTATLDALDITEWSGYSKLREYQDPANWDNFTVVDSAFLWLGGAVLIVRLKTSRGFVEAHRFDYAGTAPGTFMRSPNQPVRYEIRSSTGDGNFRYICSDVNTEGNIGASGESVSAFNTSAISCNSVGTIYALLGLKKSTSYRDNAVKIVDFSASVGEITTDSGILMVVQNPTLSAALTYGSYSRFQLAYATNQTLTAGTGRVLASCSVSSQSGGVSALENNFLAWMSSMIDNSHDEYVLAYMPTTLNQSVHGIINVKEY